MFVGCISFYVDAQKRVTLVEHFTGASCPPCAQANPIVDPIYASNFPNVVVIKYQFPAGGPDIMYSENPQDVNIRANFYNNDFAPFGFIDGNYTTGDPRTIMTDRNLRAAYERPSNWEISLDYEFVQPFNLKVTMKIKSLIEQTGTFKAHIALIEEEINYDVAPGTNREKKFLHVMRKMLPDANGTSLKAEWAIDEEVTIVEEVMIPNYYRNIDELAIVAFVQNNATKGVEQAAYAAPTTFENTLDIELEKIEPLSREELTPTVTVKNKSDETISIIDFIVTYPNGEYELYTWEGTLDANSSEIITFTDFEISLVSGSYKYKITAVSPNGIIDVKNIDNTKSTNYLISFYEPVELPIFEDFERLQGSTLVYVGGIDNSIIVDWNDGGTQGAYWSGASWKLGANNSEAALLFRNFSNSVLNDVDEYYLPTVNLENIKNPALSFHHAYCPRSKTTSDSLVIQVSINEGLTWKDIYKEGGQGLNTTSSQYSAAEYIPQTAAAWNKTELSLSDYAGELSVIVRFRVVNGYNNTLALDQILLEDKEDDSSIDNKNITNNSVFVSNSTINIVGEFTSATIYDISGRVVKQLESNQNSFVANNGVYIVKIKTIDNEYTQKVVVK